MPRKNQRPKSDIEFKSYNEYLNSMYPKSRIEESVEEDATFGNVLAEESLKLMRKLLSKKRISCTRN